MERSRDWLEQAKRDLRKAQNDLDSEYYEWACFTSQQAAAKAVKALYQSLHAEAWGHAIGILLKSLPDDCKASEWLIEDALCLDKFYIPTRYPNGFDSGSPKDYFTRKDAQTGIDAASRIIQFCEYHISGPEPSDFRTEGNC